MAYETSGIAAAAKGSSAILGIQKDMQEAAVRPRELEAATSLHESRATMAKSQISTMERLAGLDKKGAELLKASGEAMNAANANKYRIQAYAAGGEAEGAVKAQSEQNTLEINAMKLQSNAIDLEADKNDLTSAHLSGMTSMGQYTEYAQAQLKEAEMKYRSPNATPQDAMRVKKIREALSNAAGWEESVANGRLKPEDATFSKFKELEIKPLIENLKRDAERKILLDDENRKTQLAETKRHNEQMEIYRRQEHAAKREGNGLSKQLAFNIAAAKLDDTKKDRIHKIQLEIDKLKDEKPQTKVSGSGIGGSTWFEDMGVNPLITSKEQEIEDLKTRHDENLEGLQKALRLLLKDLQMSLRGLSIAPLLKHGGRMERK